MESITSSFHVLVLNQRNRRYGSKDGGSFVATLGREGDLEKMVGKDSNERYIYICIYNIYIYLYTLPETNMEGPKMMVWKR